MQMVEYDPGRRQPGFHSSSAHFERKSQNQNGRSYKWGDEGIKLLGKRKVRVVDERSAHLTRF